MTVEHLSATSTPKDIANILERDGCAVVDRVASRETLGRVEAEMAPYIEANAKGPDEFSGKNTRRTGGLIARSPTARELIEHPTVLGSVKELLSHATNIQLHLTQMITIGPGETAQSIHRDQWAFDFFPFPMGFEVQCNTIWAMTDFTEENGGTRVIPGSHRYEDRLPFTESDTEAVEMEAGSVLFYTGAIYHGGGANRSDAVRSGLNITYNLAWLRQEENQYLTVPLEIARELPESLLRLMGYARGAYALGYLDDLRDPIEAVRSGAGETGLGNLQAAAKKIESA